MKYLLDTNIVSNPASVRPDDRIVRRLASKSAVCAIPAPVWHELLFGCNRLPRGERRARLEDYIEDVVRPIYPILPYDAVAAAWHAAERARLETSGCPTPFVDGQIAAVAATTGLILVTRNKKDFSRFRALKIDDWS